LKFKGVPYQDNESTGSVLNESGKQLERDVSGAIRASKRVIPLLDSELTAIVTDLQTGNARSATKLRLVMLTGLFIAIVLAALVTTLLLARQRQDASLRQARQQTADILRTVKDGLFLLDENLVIGASYSSALESLFQRSDFAGLPFEKLLRNVVSEKTLSTAVKFVGVLWSERTKENLVKTINPLGEVEVNFDTGQGKVSTRYLQFEFHRGARRRENYPRTGVGIGCQCAGGSCPRTAVLSNPGAGAGRYIVGHIACRSDAAGLILERLQRRHENDQRGAA